MADASLTDPELCGKFLLGVAACLVKPSYFVVFGVADLCHRVIFAGEIGAIAQPVTLILSLGLERNVIRVDATSLVARTVRSVKP